MNGGARASRWTGAALAIAAVAVYLPSLGAGFYSDDYQWLGRMNATLERPSFVFSVFFRDFNPVLHADFALDWILSGFDARGWHLHSMLFHGLCAWLLFVVCRRLGAGVATAAAATLLWATNVRLSEAVLWPAARGHQWAALTALAALALLLGERRGSRVAALACVALGLFAKETTLFAAAALPVFLLGSWRRERRFLLALGALAAGFVLLNVAIKDDLHTSGAGLEALLLKVPFLLLRPLGLGDLYRFDLFGLAVTAAAFAAAAWWLRRGPGLAGLAWVLACTAPIVPLDKLSSRYLYLPAIGYSIVLCAVVARVGERLREARPRRLALAGSSLVALLVVAANSLRIAREAEDYRLLGLPYAALVERFAPAAASLVSGETVVVLDRAPQTTIPRLTEEVLARGNLIKLIPYRRHAIDGLIELPDLLNVARPREPGVLARPLPRALGGPERRFVYDGLRFVETAPPGDAATLPAERLHRARWGPAAEFYRR